MGQSPKGETFNENQNAILFFQGRSEFGQRFPKPRLYTTSTKRMAYKNDILFSVRAPVGDINIAIDDCCIGRELCAIKHKKGFQSYALYAVSNVSPNQIICYTFNKNISHIDNKIENQTLTKIRDILLPQLLSGKLRIADVENFIKD